MADQTVRISNLPNAGSPEAVALELWKNLRKLDQSADEQLAFYVKCWRATYGNAPKS